MDEPSPKDRQTARRPASIDKLAELIRSVFTIKGVDGVGQPVTFISPGDLPPDMLGFVERLRGGAIECNDEMFLLTLQDVPNELQGQERLEHRLRLAFALLCNFGLEHSVSAERIASLFVDVTSKIDVRVIRSTKGD